MPTTYVSLERVLDFVDRTTSHGAPLRVAAKRAERRFGVNRNLLIGLAVARSRSHKGLVL